MLFFKLALCVFVFGATQAKPGLKQGGAACFPESNYCLNGGTCYTQYTQQPVPVTMPPTYPPTTTPCSPPVTTPEACIPPVVYTTTTTQAPPTTTQYVWVTEPVCGCQPQFVGDRCEEPVTEATTLPTVTYTYAPETTTQPACIPYTEAPVSRCDAVQCLNGGSCNEISVEPFVLCVCPSEFTGARCETQVSVDTTTTATATTTATTTVGPYNIQTNAPVTHEPRCNYTISLLNDGAYTARMRVSYKIDGVQQPLWTSNDLPFIGNRASITIPWYSTDIIVSLERLGFNWAGIAQDAGLGPAGECNKCYKVWNDVSNPRWDYVEC